MTIKLIVKLLLLIHCVILTIPLLILSIVMVLPLLLIGLLIIVLDLDVDAYEEIIIEYLNKINTMLIETPRNFIKGFIK